MKPAISRIVVLSLASRAHGEALHGSTDAVIGKSLNNSETRAAIGAIGEGITITPVIFIKYLSQTIRTGRDVGQDQGCLGLRLIAPSYFETLVSHRIKP